MLLHQVSESMRTKTREMAENNLAQEQVMAELKNQIAIIRSGILSCHVTLPVPSMREFYFHSGKNADLQPG